MFVLGVAVTFSGVLSEIVAAGQRVDAADVRAAGLHAAGPIPERLFGWVIALALAVPAALFLLPPRHHDDLRRHAARVCRTLADRLEGAPPPTTSPGDGRAAGQLPRRRLPAGRADRGQPRAGPGGRRPAVAVRPRHATPAASCWPRCATRRAGAARCAAGAAAPREPRTATRTAPTWPPRSPRSGRSPRAATATTSSRSSASPTTATAIGVGRKLLTRDAPSRRCVGTTGRVIGIAAAADARPVWARVLGRRLPDSGAADRLLSESGAPPLDHGGFLANRGGRGAQQPAHRPRPGAGRRRHPRLPRPARLLGGARRDVGAAQQRADHRHPGGARRRRHDDRLPARRGASSS